MRKRNLDEFKQMDIKALVEKSKELKKEIANLVMDKNLNALKDLKSIFKKRKELARVLTIMNLKKELEKLEGENNKKGKIAA